MFEDVSCMFDQMSRMLKRLKKKRFEENTQEFRTTYGDYFDEMKSSIEQANEPGIVVEEISLAFCNSVENKFSKGAKKKIPAYLQVDLNFFMIYYVFPAILDCCGEYGKELADSVCKEWGNHFKDSKIGYTSYEKLYEGFQSKFLGLFKID